MIASLEHGNALRQKKEYPIMRELNCHEWLLLGETDLNSPRECVSGPSDEWRNRYYGPR